MMGKHGKLLPNKIFRKNDPTAIGSKRSYNISKRSSVIETKEYLNDSYKNYKKKKFNK